MKDEGRGMKDEGRENVIASHAKRGEAISGRSEIASSANVKKFSLLAMTENWLVSHE